MKIRAIALAAMLLLPAALCAQTPAPGSPRTDSLVAQEAPPDPVRSFMYELADPLALANALVLGLYDHART